MAPMTLEKLEDVKRLTGKTIRVTYTELARGKEWRSQLADQEIIAIDDKGATTAWIVSDECLCGMLALMDELLAELESAQVQAMLDARAGYQDWRGGEDLEQAAMARFESRKAELKAIVHGN